MRIFIITSDQLNTSGKTAPLDELGPEHFRLGMGRDAAEVCDVVIVIRGDEFGVIKDPDIKDVYVGHVEQDLGRVILKALEGSDTR